MTLEKDGPNGHSVSVREYIERIEHERWEAHRQEHILIERALDKAQQLREEAITEARRTVEGRLELLNNLRSEVQEDRGSYVTKEALNAHLAPLRELQETRGSYVTKETLATELEPLKEFRSRAIGAGIVLGLLGGSVGAVIIKVLGGA